MKEVMSSFTEAVKDGKIALVLSIVKGSGDNKFPNVFENLMSLMLTEKITGKELLNVLEKKDNKYIDN